LFVIGPLVVIAPAVVSTVTAALLVIPLTVNALSFLKFTPAPVAARLVTEFAWLSNSIAASAVTVKPVPLIAAVWVIPPVVVSRLTVPVLVIPLMVSALSFLKLTPAPVAARLVTEFAWLSNSIAAPAVTVKSVPLITAVWVIPPVVVVRLTAPVLLIPFIISAWLFLKLTPALPVTDRVDTVFVAVSKAAWPAVFTVKVVPLIVAVWVIPSVVVVRLTAPVLVIPPMISALSFLKLTPALPVTDRVVTLWAELSKSIAPVASSVKVAAVISPNVV
jgi:hypothetical protein